MLIFTPKSKPKNLTFKCAFVFSFYIQLFFNITTHGPTVYVSLSLYPKFTTGFSLFYLAILMALLRKIKFNNFPLLHSSVRKVVRPFSYTQSTPLYFQTLLLLPNFPLAKVLRKVRRLTYPLPPLYLSPLP